MFRALWLANTSVLYSTLCPGRSTRLKGRKPNKLKTSRHDTFI